MYNSSVDLLLGTISHHADDVCLVDDKRSVTFREFFLEACRVARSLEAEKTAGQPVLVYLPKCLEAVESVAGILLSGNIYVPLDIKSPLERTAGIVGNMGPCGIVTSALFREQAARLAGAGARLLCIEDMEPVGPEVSIEDLAAECRERTARVIDLDPCYIIHTSGSTGTPKGVVVPHRGVIDYIEWARQCLGVGERDIIGNQAPLYFDNSILDIFLSWSTGATLDLIPESRFLFPVKLVEYLEEHRVTFVFFVPSVLVNVSKVDVLSPGRLPALKKIVFAGEVMPTKHLAYWQRHLPDRFYANLYGPTEITVDCTYFIVDRVYGSDEDLPIGYPRDNASVLILDEADHPVGPGETGELCVRGSCLALGYWNDPENTQAAFTQNPLQTAYFDRIYRTGDLVRCNDKGQIVFIGRKDFQIKHMGFRIELGEIEKAAVSIPSMTNCCVLYDRGKQEIVLCYESERDMDPGEMRNVLASKIPAYMIPKRFRRFEALPLSPNGKVDRKALSIALG